MYCKWAAVTVTLLAFTAVILAQLPFTVAEAQVTQNPATVTIRLENDKTLYLPDEVVRIRILVTNVGNETIKVWHTGQELVVYDSQGEPIYYLLAELMPAHPFILTPRNETLLSGEVWNQTCRTPGGGTVKVPAGIYKITIKVTLIDATNEEATSKVTASATTSIATTANPNAQLIIISLTAVSAIAVSILAATYIWVEKGKSKSRQTPSIAKQ